jgi:sigma-B regulation protein RsbU (phosphoserine phosphatase)
MATFEPTSHLKIPRNPVRTRNVSAFPGPGSAPRGRRANQEQLARAARLQRLLLPDISMPVGEFRLASVYCPCETLGGDIYDLTWRSDCAMLLVADVMGHGVEAALITMLARATFVETAGETSDPATVLAGMRARLHRLLPDRVYVAAGVARLPLGGGTVELANAGLPHPFVLRATDPHVEELALEGVPLGLFLDQDLAPTTTGIVSLAPGDVLLLASDGIGSFEGRDGQLFQDGQLLRALERLAGSDGHAVLEGLASTAAGFSDTDGLPDDINLISVSRRAARPSPGAGKQ